MRIPKIRRIFRLPSVGKKFRSEFERHFLYYSLWDTESMAMIRTTSNPWTYLIPISAWDFQTKTMTPSPWLAIKNIFRRLHFIIYEPQLQEKTIDVTHLSFASKSIRIILRPRYIRLVLVVLKRSSVTLTPALPF